MSSVPFSHLVLAEFLVHLLFLAHFSHLVSSVHFSHLVLAESFEHLLFLAHFSHFCSSVHFEHFCFFAHLSHLESSVHLAHLTGAASSWATAVGAVKAVKAKIAAASREAWKSRETERCDIIFISR